MERIYKHTEYTERTAFADATHVELVDPADFLGSRQVKVLRTFTNQYDGLCALTVDNLGQESYHRMDRLTPLSTVTR